MDELKTIHNREELYELVWSMPVFKFAEQYGVSGRGFAKMCAGYAVPVPPRGYWAKVAAGKNVKKTRLKKGSTKVFYPIRPEPIIRTAPGDIARAAAYAEKTRLREEQRNDPFPQITAAPIMLEDLGEKPHRAVAAIIRSLRKAKPDAEGVITAPGVFVHQKTLERAAVILHNLARTCEIRNAKLTHESNGLYFVTTAGSLRIALNEERRCPKRMPTPEEQANYVWLKKQFVKMYGREPTKFERLEAWPKFDVVHTGNLALNCLEDNVGLRARWADGKSQTVETLLPYFVTGMEMIFVARLEKARLNAQRERQRQIDEYRRYLAGERAKRDKERLAYLEWIAKTRDEIANLRKTIDAVPKSSDLPPEYARMIDWSRERLRGLEEQTSVEVLQSALLQRNLFPDPDPLKDPHDVAPHETGRS